MKTPTPERSVEEILEGLRCETCSEERQFGSPPNSDVDNLYVYTDLSGATRVFCKDHMTYFKDGKFPALSYNDDWNGVGYGAELLSDVLQILQTEHKKQEEAVEAERKRVVEYIIKIIDERLPNEMTEEEMEKYHCEGSILYWGKKLHEAVNSLTNDHECCPLREALTTTDHD